MSPVSFQALGEVIDQRLGALRERLRKAGADARERASSLRQSAVGFRLDEWVRATRDRLEAFAPTWRERIHSGIAVLLSLYLIIADIQGHERNASVGYAFLAATIGYAIFINIRNRAWKPRKLTTRRLVLFCLGLYMANGLFAATMGAYAAIVATIFLTSGFLWTLRERRVGPNPFRRLLAAFLLSLLPLGWMAYDYWHVLGEEARQAEEEISENLRERMKPVLASLERAFTAETQGLPRVRRPDELVHERIAEMSRAKAVALAFYLPSSENQGNAMFARKGEGVPPWALGPGFSHLIQQASERLAQESRPPARRVRQAVRQPARQALPWKENHSSWGSHEMLTQSERGNGYILAWTIPGDGHYGVVLSQRYLIEHVAARELEKQKLAGKVRIVNAFRPASRAGRGAGSFRGIYPGGEESSGDGFGLEGEGMTLIGASQMPAHWSFAEALIEPDAFAKAKAAVNSRMLIAQVWFAVLVVWLGAAFLNMYRTATKDMALADMKSNFVSSVTHELKTPLGMIRMYSEMLQLGLVGEGKKSEDYLHIITGEADRLARLIDNVLDFSKIQKGTKTYTFADVDLREVALAAIRSLEGAFDSGGKEVEIEAPEAIVVHADRDSALQATINLLSNAVKYGGPHIKVSLAKIGAEVHLDVQDDGSGIPLAEQKNVFLPFYRMGREEERTAQGTGLGLALVNEIMRAHHGSVRLNSQPGQGSTFTLAFPAPAPVETAEETHAA